MKTIFLIFISVCAHCLSAGGQDLSGFWKGSLTMNGCFPFNNMELQIKIADGNVTGDSYHYLDINNYVKKEFRGSYNKESKRIIIQETIVTTYHIPYRCIICIKKYDLVYSKSGNQESLTGRWTGNIINSKDSCGPGAITLTRIKQSNFKEVPEIKVDTGRIRLDFYDNAEVDGDSISVVVNKKVVLSHQRLTAKPITLYLRIDEQNTFQEIEMVAENLGSIPPNTAVVIITAGNNRYQLFLSSTETKSAMIRFVYDSGIGIKKSI